MSDVHKTSIEEKRISPSYKILAEGGICISLAFVLSFFKIWRLPYGGEISLEMVPLITFSLLRGFVPGTLAGLTFGLLHFMQSSIMVHPLQFFLDYPCAFGAMGLAGLFSRQKSTFFSLWLYIFIAVLGRFFFHVLAGTIYAGYFLKTSPANPLIYAALYNASYLIPSFLISAPLIQLLVWKLLKTLR